jgi:hypothetical protein
MANGLAVASDQWSTPCFISWSGIIAVPVGRLSSFCMRPVLQRTWLLQHPRSEPLPYPADTDFDTTGFAARMK